MPSVLGIDAAWTLTNPSGVALATDRPSGWRVIAVAASYSEFLALSEPRVQTSAAPKVHTPGPRAMLDAAQRLCGEEVSLVAIDMPLSMAPITRRRESDQSISSRYGSRWAGTHTPSATRPGAISDNLRREFQECGYPLRVACDGSGRGLIEVYPHPALIELANSEKRLPYKLSKARSYWPSHSKADRRTELVAQWLQIAELLEPRLAGVSRSLPVLSPSASVKELKAYEDMLDAVVCAWVATCLLAGKATAFGDSESVIWVPHGVDTP